jgi:hypothetical protein
MKDSNRLLITEDIEDEVLRNKNDSYVLFGEKFYLKNDDIECPLIFHSVKNVPLEKITPVTSLIVPIMPCKEDLDHLLLDMYEANAHNPNLTAFAVRDDSEKYRQCKGDLKVIKESLKFYEIHQKPEGKEIAGRDCYTRVNYQEYLMLFDEPEKMDKHISSLKEKINKTFSL